MTRDTQAIDALIEAVRGGDHVAVQIHAKRMASYARDRGSFFPSHEIEKAMSRNDMSAACSVREFFLPGWWWHAGADERQDPSASVWKSGIGEYSAEAETPARALLLATLKAWKETMK